MKLDVFDLNQLSRILDDLDKAQGEFTGYVYPSNGGHKVFIGCEDSGARHHITDIEFVG